MPLIRREFTSKYKKSRLRIHDLSQVLYFPFNQGLAIDRSGYNNHGTVYGATRTTGKIGEALSFNGTLDDYVELGQVVDDYPFTFIAWIKPIEIETEAVISVSLGTDVNFHGLVVFEDCIIARSYNGSLHDAGTPIVAGIWSFVAGIWVNASLRKVYLNSVYKAQNTDAIAGIGLDKTTIGRTADSTPWGSFGGIIDEPRIFKKVLSLGEMHRLMYMRGA